MLNFILGRAGSGKSTFMMQQMKTLLEQTELEIVLLVPEQFSFETERNIYRSFCGRDVRRIEVVSFMRLANSIFRRYGGLAGEYADASDKTILMSLALDQLKDALKVYGKTSNISLTRSMLEAVDEFKTWGVVPQQLEQAAGQLSDGLLKDKLSELSMIYSAYEGILGRLYLDPLDDIARAGRILETHPYFAGKALFIDEFDGFTANEAGILRAALRQAENVTVSLCMPSARVEAAELFAPVAGTYHKLIRLARENGAAVSVPVTMEPGKRFVCAELAHLEQNILSSHIEQYQGECRAVRLFAAPNEFEEAEFVLATVKKLVQEDGYRYRDIVVTARDLEPYQETLKNGFAHYDIPFYMDMLSPVTEKALIRFVESLLKTAAGGCTMADVLSLLKCGLLDYSAEDAARFENYVYTWDIKGSALHKEFTAHPRGYEVNFTQADGEELAFVNHIRATLADAAERLKKLDDQANGKEISAAVYTLLEELHVKENVRKAAGILSQAGQEMLADETVQIWDVLMEILDSLAKALDGAVPLKRYLELYQLVAANYQVGAIPQQLDAVTVGSSERIRTANPRAVFVLGANDGIFPYVPTAQGLLTDQEKTELSRLEIELSRNTEEMILQERFLAYKALTGASERLYLSWRRADVSGKPVSASFLTDQIESMFTKRCRIAPEELDGLYYCRSGQTAFSQFAASFGTDTPLRSTLEQFLRERGYGDRIQKLYQMLYRRGYHLENKEAAMQLFGREMQLSATRFEDYHKCRFLYFCKNGLRAYPRKKAELNRLETGTLIHDVLYEVMSDPMHPLSELSDPALKKVIGRLLDAYIEEKMGGAADKTKRFLYLYHRLNQTLFQILSHLREEARQSSFIPTDFELPVGHGKAVDALEVTAPDGTRLWVEGKIDRVDTYEKNGVKYVRIIDYKSGGKEFALDDVVYGLNMQMLIYLFAVWNTRTGKYKGSMPAGILYMPANRADGALPRDADADSIAAETRKVYRMNGLVLDDEEILDAMDHGISGVFIPVRRLTNEKKLMDDNGEEQIVKYRAGSSIASLSQLGELKRYTEKLLGDMAAELHNGEIAALPLANGNKLPCDYCDYRAVCGRQEDDPAREKQSFDKPADIYRKIEESFEDGKKTMDQGTGACDL